VKELVFNNTGYFMSDNEPGGIENATHNTLERKPGHGGDKNPTFPPDVLWAAFSIPPTSLSLVKYPVYSMYIRVPKVSPFLEGASSRSVMEY
jgi:hypothetical protein